MIRFLRRKLLFCIFLIALFLTLKRFIPEIGSTIGRWISGTADERVSSVFSEMLESFTESTKDAVEVFADGLQDIQED